MRGSVAWLAVLALVLASAAARSARAETVQLVVDGQQRTYLLERPHGREPRPTLIMLHGAGGTAQGLAQWSGLAQSGPRDAFAVVFPQSHAHVWNRFLPGTESPEAIEMFRPFGGPPNDVGFLKALIADLVQRGIADPARIYLAGYSNGGFMTLTMFCLARGQFAGIGLILSSMSERIGDECHPARPVPVLMLNGTADAVVPYRGGVVPPLDRSRPAPTFVVWSADRVVAFFRRLNGCSEPAQSSAVWNPQPQSIEVEFSGNCAGGPVAFYRVVGGGHQVPAVLNAGQMLLDFFRDKVR